MKILFLDIDGVVNTDRIARYRKNHGVEEMIFDEDAMKNLEHIVTSTECRIVISSTWRIHRDTMNPLWIALVDNLRKYNLENFLYDTTHFDDPVCFSKPRWLEIKEWLVQNRDIDSFVILDDEWDMDELNSNFVRCSGAIGISRNNCKEAIAILNNESS